MSNIKLFFVENTDNSTEIRNKLQLLSNSVYTITSELYMVEYEGTPKELYDSLSDTISGKNIFIQDVNTTGDTYWGYMNKELWEWINNHYVKEVYCVYV